MLTSFHYLFLLLLKYLSFLENTVFISKLGKLYSYLPKIAGGNVSAWIGVGSLNSNSRIAFNIDFGRPKLFHAYNSSAITSSSPSLPDSSSLFLLESSFPFIKMFLSVPPVFEGVSWSIWNSVSAASFTEVLLTSDCFFFLLLTFKFLPGPFSTSELILRFFGYNYIPLIKV